MVPARVASPRQRGPELAARLRHRRNTDPHAQERRRADRSERLHDPAIVIRPDDAEPRGIESGDWVEVAIDAVGGRLD
jgi:anaerobic selenocysteine-containing dehydrogenase